MKQHRLSIKRLLLGRLVQITALTSAVPSSPLAASPRLPQFCVNRHTSHAATSSSKSRQSHVVQWVYERFAVGNVEDVKPEHDVDSYRKLCLWSSDLCHAILLQEGYNDRGGDDEHCRVRMAKPN